MAPVPSSKVRIPHRLPATLTRPDLQEALDRGAGRALTLLIAPPGYGKTVLMADWARRRQAAWLSLDEDDDAAGRFWPAVVAALAVVAAPPRAIGTGGRLRGLVERWTGRAWSPGDGMEFVAELIEVGGRSAAPVELVLDGTEQLHDPEVLTGLTVLLRSAQESVRLVLAGRVDPALPVARLRVDGRLCELRADDLRFTVDDCGRLLRDAGVLLDPAQVTLLHARTGGWVAPLRLATLRLHEHRDPNDVLAGLPDDRSIGEYLDTEILVNLSDDERSLLGLVSVADPVPAGLAVALSGRDDAADVLDRLRRRTGLLTATGTWGTEYRTQELLRSSLSADLERHDGDVVRILHERAARWWTDQGRPVEALRHAGLAGESGLVTGLLNRWAAVLAARGEHTLLLSPPTTVDADGSLLLSAAAAHLGQGRLGDTVRALSRARRGNDRHTAELAAYRVAVERLAGIPSAGPAADEWRPDEPALAALCLLGRSAARLFSAVPAGPDLRCAGDLATSYGFAFVWAQCRSLLAVADWLQGDLVHAVEHATAAQEAAVAGGWRGSPWTAAAQAAAAHALLLRGLPRHAKAVCAQGLSAAPGVPAIGYALHTVSGAARFADGDRERGLEEMRHARVELGAAAAPAAVCAAGALLEQQAALALGYPTAAATALGWLAARVPTGPELAVGRARAEAAAGRVDAARATVRPLLGGEAAAPVLPCTPIDAWLIETNAACAAGDRAAARRALRTALALAEPRDAVQPFVALDARAGTLLMDVVGGGLHAAAGFPARASSIAHACSAPPLPVGFSGRELDVLARLPSLLSLDDIAHELGVSVNTVKTHLRSIYAKLGVTNRRAAVLGAHDQRALV